MVYKNYYNHIWGGARRDFRKQVQLYHGSNVIVKEPQVLTNGYYKDFGYGFYCTSIEKQAERWALVKFKYPTHQMVFCTEKALEMLSYEGSYSL